MTPRTPLEPRGATIDEDRIMYDGRSRAARALVPRAIALGVACLLLECSGTPTQPTALPTGRWASNGGACLTVAADMCDLVVGCGHGQFPPPVIRADGTFDVDGTYRVEAGPISINPPPPAKFSGVLKGQTLTISVTPSDPALQPATYLVQLTGGLAKCSVPCV